MYAKFFKRPLSFILALIAFIVLFPVLLILTILGASPCICSRSTALTPSSRLRETAEAAQMLT